jgi:pseudouridine-5'-phosphate glycosidase
LEAIARAEGCVPATVAILGGRLQIGLDDAMLDRLADGERIAKVGLSNLAAVIARRGDGATTVSGTMLACDLAGIEVFATGGIGGVHPGAAETFDVSSDLTALGRFQVTVVSAGAKAILDIPATLQALETRGVPVIGFGTDRFPTFYSPAGECAVDARVDTVSEAAAAVRAHRANPHAAGLLLANPIPLEDARPDDLIADAIAKAHSEAQEQGITGRAVTPFLLAAVERHTGSASLQANRALIENNARLGARLARTLCPESP